MVQLGVVDFGLVAFISSYQRLTLFGYLVHGVLVHSVKSAMQNSASAARPRARRCSFNVTLRLAPAIAYALNHNPRLGEA